MIAIERASSPPQQRAGPTSALRGLAHCAMPASPEAARKLRRFARAVARRWRLAEHLDEALSVIVTELVTNVVLHSGSTWVSAVISVRGDALTVEVMDGGRWKHRVTRRKEPLDADVVCGRGLRMVEAYATRTVARRLEAGSIVWAEITMPDGTPGDQPSVNSVRIADHPTVGPPRNASKATARNQSKATARKAPKPTNGSTVARDR